VGSSVIITLGYGKHFGYVGDVTHQRACGVKDWRMKNPASFWSGVQDLGETRSHRFVDSGAQAELPFLAKTRKLYGDIVV